MSLPTTNNDWRFDGFKATFTVAANNGPNMTIEQAIKAYPEDRDYLIWFEQTYNR